MRNSADNLGRYARLALLLLMLAAQGIAVAHEIGEDHRLQSHSCATCIIGQGLDTAVSVKNEAPTVHPRLAFAPPTRSITAILTPRVNSHAARAPPHLS